MSPFTRTVWRSAASLVLGVAMSACAASGQAQVGELNGPGPYGQFIVKYRDGTAPQNDSKQVQARLSATAASSGLPGTAKDKPLMLTWKHRMGINADVFKVERPLDRAEASRLMAQFAADPDVEFIEPDAMMSIQPVDSKPLDGR